jgi:hypothetical protein
LFLKEQSPPLYFFRVLSEHIKDIFDAGPADWALVERGVGAAGAAHAQVAARQEERGLRRVLAHHAKLFVALRVPSPPQRL